jgi:aminoglycoside phosphotransferase (APT) family kinase protein
VSSPVRTHGGGIGADVTILGEELARLLDRQGLAIARIVPVTSLASPIADRAAFRVELEDGTSIKARRFKSEAAVLQLQLLEGWSGVGLPAILAAEGRSALVEWVEGEDFDARPRAAQDYESCGDLLGRLHTFSPAGGRGDRRPAPAPRRSKTPATVTGWRTKVVEWSRRLAEGDRITLKEARGVVSRLDTAAPLTVEVGPTHLDYSAGNLVLDRNGNPVAIDNETISLGPLDLDLAICERRWPMEDWQRAAFERGYERHRDLTGYRGARAFWHLCYLTRRAALKSRRPGNAEASALEALRALLDEGPGGESGEL